MSELHELYKKIKFELNEAKESKSTSLEDEEKNNESETAFDEQPKKGGLLGVRQVTSRTVVGRVNKDFDWQVDFDTLRKAICDEVITVDINKTKKIFKLIKDYINNKEKFETKYKK